MMPRFMPLNYQLNTMVVINYLDQLQPDAFEYAVHHLIDSKLDLSVFYPKYQNDETGRPSYNPAALLKIILFAYSKGIRSSRAPKFTEQKQKYGKRHQDNKIRKKAVIPASEFQFDPVSNSCVCPSGQTISFRGMRKSE